MLHLSHVVLPSLVVEGGLLRNGLSMGGVVEHDVHLVVALTRLAKDWRARSTVALDAADLDNHLGCEKSN